MTLLDTDDVVTSVLVSEAEDAPGESHHEESTLQRLVRLLALSYSKMPLFP